MTPMTNLIRAALAVLAALALTLTLATGALAQPGGGTEDPPPAPCEPADPNCAPPPPTCDDGDGGGGETPPPPGTEDPCQDGGSPPPPPTSSPFARVFERMNAAVDRIPAGPARERAEVRVARVQTRLCQVVPRFC